MNFTYDYIGNEIVIRKANSNDLEENLFNSIEVIITQMVQENCINRVRFNL